MISNEELSALVAEKVMGLHLLKEDRTRCVAALNKRGTAAGMQDQPVPAFATDAGLALEAALKATVAVGSSVEIGYENNEFWVSICRRWDRPSYFTGATLAWALCLAALHAVGVAVNDDEANR